MNANEQLLSEALGRINMGLGTQGDMKLLAQCVSGRFPKLVKAMREDGVLCAAVSPIEKPKEQGEGPDELMVLFDKRKQLKVLSSRLGLPKAIVVKAGEHSITLRVKYGLKEENLPGSFFGS